MADEQQGHSDDPPDGGASVALLEIEEQADARIRRELHEGRMFFSVIDVVGVLTDAPTPRMYWADMKRTVHAEGFVEVLEKIQQLKMRAADGRLRLTDAADTETLLRLIQSIPSPKAEPVKQWLAKVGARKLQEAAHPLSSRAAASEIATAQTLQKPAEHAPALAWAEYYEHLATLYRRQAAYEAQLAFVDATLAEHDQQIGELHSRVESLEEGQRLLPELLERLGPQTLSPEHQRTVQTMAKRLHEAGSAAYATIYAELGEHFHVAKYDQIAEARWPEVAEWFQRRIAAAERRHQ